MKSLFGFSLFFLVFLVLVSYSSPTSTRWGENWKTQLSSPYAIAPQTTSDLDDGISWLKEIRQKKHAHDIVISASFPRSGGTVLFNMIRLLEIMKQGSEQNVVGTFSKWSVLRAADQAAVVMKVHTFSTYWVQAADTTVVTLRDPRAAIASMIAMWPHFRGQMPYHVEQLCEHTQSWIESAVYMVHYEDLKQNQTMILNELADILSIRIRPDQLLQVSNNLSALTPPVSEIDVVTQLHPKHRTHKGDVWDEVLSPGEIMTINTKCRQFMEKAGYDWNCTKPSECHHSYEKGHSKAIRWSSRSGKSGSSKQNKS